MAEPDEPGDAADEPGDAADEPGDAADEPGDAADEPGDAADEPGDAAGEYATERSTAPQSPYSTRDVAIGFVVLVIGLLITFAIPLVLG